MNEDDLSQDLSFLSQTPDKLKRLLNGVSERNVNRRVMPEEFSLGETLCHLRDIECEGYAVRIKRILAEDNPDLADIDGAKLAVERDYGKQNASEALRRFSEARQSNIETLKCVKGEQWNRLGQLENSGPVSLGQLVQMMREHDESHLNEAQGIHKDLSQEV